MIKLYGHELSGNVYKVRLLLSLLDLEYEFVRLDLMKGEHKFKRRYRYWFVRHRTAYSPTQSR